MIKRCARALLIPPKPCIQSIAPPNQLTRPEPPGIVEYLVYSNGILEDLGGSGLISDLDVVRFDMVVLT